MNRCFSALPAYFGGKRRLAPAALELDELEDLIRPYRPNIEALQVPYPHLGSIASEAKNARNKEFIVLANK